MSCRGSLALVRRRSSAQSLTEKILSRAALVERIGRNPDPMSAHMTASTSRRTSARWRCAGIPIYGCDPSLVHLGSKSGSRETFRRAGVPLPDGHERLRDANDIVHALADLKRRDVSLRRAMVKLDEGFSGEGNAVFSFDGVPVSAVRAQTADPLVHWVRNALPSHLQCVADVETWESFLHKFSTMHGIVECFVPGEVTRSPSVQCPSIRCDMPA